DLVDCYLRAVEQRVPGILHAVDDTYATLNACAAAVAPGAAVEHVPADAARASIGAFVDALVVDQHVSSAATRQKLGWSPKRDFVGSVSVQWAEWRAALRRTAQDGAPAARRPARGGPPPPAARPPARQPPRPPG